MSVSWYSVIFTPDQIARLEHLHLEDEFDLLYASSGSPRGMALFGLKSFTNYPIYYFSPESWTYINGLLKRYAAVPCKEPDPKEVSFLAGDVNISTQLIAQQLSFQQYISRMRGAAY